MRVLISFRWGEGETVHTRYYDLDQEDYLSLKQDFLAYLNDGATALRGSSYKYTDVDTGQARELLLRFDAILCIECMPQEGASGGQGATKPATGPLQARIAGSANSTGNTGPIATQGPGTTEASRNEP